MEDSCCNGRFKILHRIGEGNYADVHLGVDTTTSTDVAIKIEKRKQRSKRRHLTNEGEIYAKLRAKNFIFAPNILYYGEEEELGREEVQILVMEKLGASLLDVYKERGCFSVVDVRKLAVQLISCLQSLHELNIVHSDVKPSNILMGVGEESDSVRLVDFGLSASYWDESSDSHCGLKYDCPIKGTLMYMSINSHVKCRPSRRDDLESLGYTLVYLAKGFLPWRVSKRDDSRQNWGKVLIAKRAATSGLICQGLPLEFAKYTDYCRSLPFSKKPDYCYLKKLFQC